MQPSVGKKRKQPRNPNISFKECQMMCPKANIKIRASQWTLCATKVSSRSNAKDLGSSCS